MATSRVPISFVLGSRKLLEVPRNLETLSFSLEQVLDGQSLPDLEVSPDCEGFRVLSAPIATLEKLQSRLDGFVFGGCEEYRRHYIAMTGSFEDYLARFSGKTRSTLRRKTRKFAEADGGELDFSEYRTPAEIEAFLAEALPLSERTYQARLLDAGLPHSDAARRHMLALAAEDRMRCYLLRMEGSAAAYLSLPVEGETLVYAHLGYDPALSKHSPGTVLQMAALERLFAENRFRYFDFTEGDGAHKSMFGTDSAECASFLALRATAANRMLLSARDGFDAAVAGAKSLAARTGAEALLRRALRA